MNNTVLIVDPRRISRRATILALRYGGFETETSATAQDALGLLRRRQRATMLIVDPDDEPDAADAIEQLRAVTTAPIIVLSADCERDRKVALLDAGADDYLTRPFDPEELLARVRAALRRVVQIEEETPFVTDDFTIYVRDRRLVRADGTKPVLSPIEWRLIEVLAEHAGHLVTREDLLTSVWGPQAIDKTQYLRVHMSSIRHKIEPDSNHPRYFLTVPGLGIRFDPTGNATSTTSESG
jgi:two-component system KDP operon response regulator KdpE